MISHKLETSISYMGKRYGLNLSHDVVLRLFELQRDALFDDASRTALSLEMLIKPPSRFMLRWIPLQDKVFLIDTIFKEFIARKSRPGGSSQKAVDFVQDADLIYASFFHAYRIDLQRSRIDWREFIALFQGLPDDTIIKKVMSIRTRDIPEQTKHNAKEIQELMQLKAYWAIQYTEEESEAMFQEGIDRLADSLLRRARAGGNSV